MIWKLVGPLVSWAPRMHLAVDPLEILELAADAQLAKQVWGRLDLVTPKESLPFELSAFVRPKGARSSLLVVAVAATSQ